MTALALAALVLTTGCSGGSDNKDGGTSEPQIGDVRTMLSTAKLSLPLDAYIADKEQRRTLNAAQDVLIDRCMRRYGFRYEGRGTASTGGQAAAQGTDSRRYGISDADAAARRGYVNTAVTGAERPPARAMGPNEKLVLHGKEKIDPADPVPMNQEEAEHSSQGTIKVDGQKVPAGGCLREGYLKLFAPSKDSVDVMVPQNFGFDAYGRAREDSRVRAAVKKWSSCMAEKGYRTDNPVSPYEDLGLDAASLDSPRAIEAAKQDVACKKRTNLVGVWATVETAYQKRLIEQNAETLDLAKKQLEERLKLASSLTS
ncbi:hypothetical protein [Streptomyces sp. CO7]